MRVFGCWKAGKIEKEAVAVVNIDNRKWLMYNKNKLIMFVYWRSLSPRASSIFLPVFRQQKNQPDFLIDFVSILFNKSSNRNVIGAVERT